LQLHQTCFFILNVPVAVTYTSKAVDTRVHSQHHVGLSVMCESHDVRP